MRFKGQTAIVTGGGRDIGAACALKLAAEGANVAVNYYASAAGADKLVAQITEAGGRAFAMKGDLNDASAVRALVRVRVGSV